jgi:hypothetical protein
VFIATTTEKKSVAFESESERGSNCISITRSPNKGPEINAIVYLV